MRRLQAARWWQSALPVQRACALCVLVCGVLFFAASFCALTLGVAAEEGLVERARTPVTIRVNTFRRNDLLATFIDHYDACDTVEELTVVWSDLDNDPPKWLERRATVAPSDAERARVVVERHAVDSLNNRFKPLARPPTPAIFSVDDDIIVTCTALSSMLEAWRSSPRQMVGVAPRLIAKRSGAYRYLRWWHVWNGKYSLVLTKVAVFHRDYLALYSQGGGGGGRDQETMAAIRAHVDEHRNCEDLAMSFLVANATDSPPIWLREHYTDFGESFGAHAGISAGGDHVQSRADCVALFAKLFRRMPLTTATHKVVNADSQWFW